MLSHENLDKLHMNGIYRCDPVLSFLPSYKRDDPYWCRNWTFKVHRYKDKYYMSDTYWSTGDDCSIELTDENYDKFEYLFDLDQVRFCNDYASWLEYPEEDRWCVGLDSGGMTMKKYVVRRGVNKVKERVIERMKREINFLKSELSSKERRLEGIINGELDYNYW